MTVFTIGHAGRSFQELERLLITHGVRTIIDIRSEPHAADSPDFDRDNVAGLARVAGLGYRWMGDQLGAVAAASGPTDGANHGEMLAADVAAALDQVLQLAAGGEVALLCTEAEPERCHRSSLLGRVLVARGDTVLHILPDGSLRRQQDTLGV